MALEDYLLAVEQVGTRLATLDAQLKEVAEQEPYRERVGWLRCFRGIDTIKPSVCWPSSTASSGSRSRQI